MRTWITTISERLRSSYWFLPGTMAIGAILLASLLIYIDHQQGLPALILLDWTVSTSPEGARALLSTIAGSMITVAGVTFSITVAAVVYATAQFGPRLLSNFLADRGNQITLGTFIATYLYCLLVLRAVDGGEGVG